MTLITGLSWGHTRGHVPLVATAQAYRDQHPDTEIRWDSRSLWAFGEQPIEELAEDYDLLVIDFPFVGRAAARSTLLPLDEHINPNAIRALVESSVGRSYASYTNGEHLWALPLDGATHVAAFRPDLLTRIGASVPATWDGVLELAASTGRVALPLTSVNALMAFFTLSANLGDEPFSSGNRRVVGQEIGLLALEKLRALTSLVDPSCYESNSIVLLRRMSNTDDLLYAPLLYGYSNYSRDGFAPQRVAFGAMPAGGAGGLRGSTLGGAGLALSAMRPLHAEALDYAAWITGAECQRTLYTLSGGQPASRLAWNDELANRVTHGFFRDTLKTIEGAWVRPNHPGFTDFQTEAGRRMQEFLRGRGEPADVLRSLDEIYAATAVVTR